ncbi:MAG: NAD(P)H-hydrate dehydratase [Succinivibrio sp.]|nr:NAD(P)H-hydrate dehydratase [Succinivibrio sp.]
MSALPYRMYTSAQVKAIEAAWAADHNGHCFDLMEKAGAALADAVARSLPRASSCWVFAGRGNNGGDGYEAAALLLRRGFAVRLFAAGEPHPRTEAATAAEFFRAQGGVAEGALPKESDPRPDAIIDALLGTGISSAPRAPLSEWIAFINRSRVPVFSADVPSGLTADTGAVPGDCVSAYATVCMLALKPGLFTGEAADYTGKVLFDPLGADAQALHAKQEDGLPAIVRQGYADIIPDLPSRPRCCNKGDNGKVLIIAGAFGMGGAAAIAGTGALRAGAGLVKLATAPATIAAANAVHPELMTVDFNDDTAVEAALSWCDTVAVGPGLGQSQRARELVALSGDSGRPCVFDADALNILAKDPDFCPNRIITPHPGEAARLLDTDVASVQGDRLRAAFELQKRYGGVALLKGAGTVIADGRRLTVISSGSPALASGGMGDLLTGIIAALACGELSLSQAAVFGACIHGRAGELAEERCGAAGTLPLDLEQDIRRLVNGRA